MRNRGFWRELKRRHVYRVGAVYAIVGWLLIQVVTQIFPIFRLPDWIDQAIVLLILVGFPIALVLAWAFDATPHGIVRTDVSPAGDGAGTSMRWRSRRAGLAVGSIGVLVAIAAGAVWWHAEHGKTSSPRDAHMASAKPVAATAASGLATINGSASAPQGIPASPIAARPIPAKSIAVLPFENLSTDKGNAYFADGMQDLILTKLADIGDLKVISRTSTMQYGSHPQNLKAIAQQLGVATILEGSVQKAGNSVLINVQLIDAQSDNHLWAESYQRTLDNIFGVEGEVAQKVADALKAKLTPVEAADIAKIPTQNKQAYDAYLKAIYYVRDSNRTLDRSELERSVPLLQQATQLDPKFVDAYVWLAQAYTNLGGNTDQVEAASRRALALDPGNAFAHSALGFALTDRGDLAAAIAQEQEAVRLQPTHAGGYNALGYTYWMAGRLDEATAALQRSIELDSKFELPRENLANTRMAQRRYGEARDALRVPVARDPANLQAATYLAQTYWLGGGDLDAARKVLQAVPTPIASSGALSDAWYWQDMYARDYAAAVAVIGAAPAAWFANQHYPRELYQAQAYQAQGDVAKARTAFAQARTPLDAWIKATPDDASLHANLALTLAGLGKNDQALREAQRAVTLQPVAKDAIHGPQKLLTLARINARIGHTDAAVQLLDHLLATPAGLYVSVPMLKLDPAWDPIRNDPRFQALLTKYENTQPAATTSGAGHD
jgi:TolB-like protein/Tfp pilus assembly protein PilF